MVLTSVFRSLGILGITISLGLAMFSVPFFGSVYASDEPDFEDIDIEDDCDPATFNAELPPPPFLQPVACLGDGDTTFEEFIEEFLEDGEVGSWEFSPDDTEIDEGEVLRLLNEGGEIHTFTRVAAFGGGFVPELNLPGVPLALECFAPPGPGPLNPDINIFLRGDGGTALVGPLAPGTYLFMCCIHPWMQLTLTVEGDCESCGGS